MARQGYLDAKFELDRELGWLDAAEKEVIQMTMLRNDPNEYQEMVEIKINDAQTRVENSKKRLVEKQIIFDKFNQKTGRPVRTYFQMKFNIMVSMSENLYEAAIEKKREENIGFAELVRRALREYLNIDEK